jgi:hypothetical protein
VAAGAAVDFVGAGADGAGAGAGFAFAFDGPAAGIDGSYSSSSSSSSPLTIFGPFPDEKNPAGRIELLTTSSVSVRARFVDSPPDSLSAGRFDLAEPVVDDFSRASDVRCCLVSKWASHCFTEKSVWNYFRRKVQRTDLVWHISSNVVDRYWYM